MSIDKPSPCRIPSSREEVMKHFDDAAATWDDNPHRRELTRAIAAGIRTNVPLQPNWRMLEYGCGTGTLSLLLAPHVQEVVAADASSGMVDQLRRKLQDLPEARVKPRLLDLTHEAPLAESFALIVAAMTLHHVPNVVAILADLGKMLAKGGWLAIADLQLEDGSFHADLKVPHNGFNPENMAHDITGAIGADSCPWRVVHEVAKPNRTYPVCLWTACKTAG
jgi:ubiquinone/menaquinone biosynthesis C-methylase UbiE